MIIMPVEGLLCSQEIPLRSAPPMAVGQTTYELGIASGLPVTLLSSQRNRQEVEAWLRREGFLRHVSLYTRDTFPGQFLEFKVHTINHLVSLGHRIKFYFDADPSSITRVVSYGIQSMLVVNPGTTVGRVADKDTYRPWDELVGTIETNTQRRADLKAEQPYQEE